MPAVPYAKRHVVADRGLNLSERKKWTGSQLAGCPCCCEMDIIDFLGNFVAFMFAEYLLRVCNVCLHLFRAFTFRRQVSIVLASHRYCRSQFWCRICPFRHHSVPSDTKSSLLDTKYFALLTPNLCFPTQNFHFLMHNSYFSKPTLFFSMPNLDLPTPKLTADLNDWLTHWLTDGLFDWMIDWLC